MLFRVQLQIEIQITQNIKKGSILLNDIFVAAQLLNTLHLDW